MPCDTQRLTPEQTLAQRLAQVDAALKALEQKLLAGQSRVEVGPTGAVAFAGWGASDRVGISDVCAYRALSVQGSWALRQAVAVAERTSGRRVNAQAVAAGFHSHDGGRSWSRH